MQGGGKERGERGERGREIDRQRRRERKEQIGEKSENRGTFLGPS